MSFIEDMDEIIEKAVVDAKDDFILEYEFDDDTHVLKNDVNTVTIYSTVDEGSEEWEIYAEVKNKANETIDTFFDCGDDLKEISSGKFENIFENFFENNILTYFNHVENN